MSKKNKFDWRKAQKILSPQAVKDLDRFLDNLPKRAGNLGLIAAGVIWMIAGLSILFAYTKSVQLHEIQTQLSEAEALKPTVPRLSHVSVNKAQLEQYVQKIRKSYSNIGIELQKNGLIKIRASSTAQYPEWRAVIDSFAYGGRSWKVKFEKMCVGRECSPVPLYAEVKIETIDVTIPKAG